VSCVHHDHNGYGGININFKDAGNNTPELHAAGIEGTQMKEDNIGYRTDNKKTEPGNI
jgi:hypothetical protein